jgi:uncharacterized protein (DUF362 family)
MISTRDKLEVVLCKSTYGNCFKNIDSVFKLLEYVPQKKAFFIKPNLVHPLPPRRGVTTSPKIIEAIILYLRKNYPGREILIGDGTGYLTNFDDVIKKSGYSYLAKKYDVSFTDLYASKLSEIAWKYGTIKIPEYVFSHEYINVPKLKTHMQTGVTLCMKNQKGLLQIHDKQNFHRKYDLNEAIMELARVVTPDMNIIDGITSLEGNGPFFLGTAKKHTNIIIASKNMYAADNVAVAVMGFDIRDIDHIPEFSEFTVIGENMADCVIPFKKADIPPIKKYNIYVHFDVKMCSLCSINVAVSFEEKISNIPFFMKITASGGMFGRKDLILGNYETVPDGARDIICIGNCSMPLAKKYHLPFISGCPPSVETIESQYLKILRRA